MLPALGQLLIIIVARFFYLSISPKELRLLPSLFFETLWGCSPPCKYYLRRATPPIESLHTYMHKNIQFYSFLPHQRDSPSSNILFTILLVRKTTLLLSMLLFLRANQVFLVGFLSLPLPPLVSLSRHHPFTSKSLSLNQPSTNPNKAQCPLELCLLKPA